MKAYLLRGPCLLLHSQHLKPCISVHRSTGLFLLSWQEIFNSQVSNTISGWGCRLRRTLFGVSQEALSRRWATPGMLSQSALPSWPLTKYSLISSLARVPTQPETADANPCPPLEPSSKISTTLAPAPSAQSDQAPFPIHSNQWFWPPAPLSHLVPGTTELDTKKFLRASRKKQAPSIRSYGEVKLALEATLTFQFLLVQSNGIFLQSKHVVSKNNNLVIPPFMKLDQKLASSEFVGVHGVQQDSFLGFDCHILPVKLRRHRAPNLWYNKNQGSVCKFKHHTTGNFSKLALKQIKTKPMVCELYLNNIVNTHTHTHTHTHHKTKPNTQCWTRILSHINNRDLKMHQYPGNYSHASSKWRKPDSQPVV